ncbi:MAG TPA: hypothetical protein VIK35_01100 [Verrucomicrobiae bacterium]
MDPSKTHASLMKRPAAVAPELRIGATLRASAMHRCQDSDSSWRPPCGRINTSYDERSNLTGRHFNKCFARLSLEIRGSCAITSTRDLLTCGMLVDNLPIQARGKQYEQNPNHHHGRLRFAGIADAAKRPRQ